MTNTVLNWVWEHSQSKHAARLVMLAIADRAREDGCAEMGVADIKKRTLLGERAVQAATIALAEAGELWVGYQQGRHGVNRYRILMTRAESAPPQTLRGADSAPPQDSHPPELPQVNTSTPANSAPPADPAPPQNLHTPPAKFAPKPKEHKNSPTESSQGGAGGTEPAVLFGAAPATPRRTRKPRPSPGPEFEVWYAIYPVHKARGEAEKAWVEVVALGGADPAELNAAAQRYRQDPQVVRGYGKHPATWLRSKCWLDEPTMPPQAANGSLVSRRQESTSSQRARAAVEAGEQLQALIDQGRYPA